ncbi:MAG TPA: PIN domain-containing protein [Thermoanaerobaculia bacterium]|nr:PIN domain-containing protein [Thermoanaerobaculia bacterium]
MPVVDASVCVALFNAGESAHAAAVAWFAAAGLGEEPIVAPVILLAEVGAALGRAGLDSVSSRAVVELLRGRRMLELFPVDEMLAARAAAIAAAHHIRGADAIYVALADQLAIALITFDRHQLERGPQVVETRMPTT